MGRLNVSLLCALSIMVCIGAEEDVQVVGVAKVGDQSETDRAWRAFQDKQEAEWEAARKLAEKIGKDHAPGQTIRIEKSVTGNTSEVAGEAAVCAGSVGGKLDDTWAESAPGWCAQKYTPDWVIQLKPIVKARHEALRER